MVSRYHVGLNGCRFTGRHYSEMTSFFNHFHSIKCVRTRDGRDRGGREGGKEGIILCDGNYGVGAYGTEWVHTINYNRNPSEAG